MLHSGFVMCGEMRCLGHGDHGMQDGWLCARGVLCGKIRMLACVSRVKARMNHLTRVCQVVCVNGSLLFLFSGEAPREADRELIANTRPILWRHRPLSRDLTCD